MCCVLLLWLDCCLSCAAPCLLVCCLLGVVGRVVCGGFCVMFVGVCSCSVFVGCCMCCVGA